MNELVAKAGFRSAIICAVALALAACPDSGSDSGAEPPPEEAPAAEQDPAAEGGDQAQNDQDEGASGGAQTAAPPSKPRALRVTIKATLEGVPAGAIVIAPSARDRAYQKVTKSEHAGIPGAVVPADEEGNLFFVSDPIAADAGTLSYVGSFEIAIREGTRGRPSAIGDASFDGDEGKTGPVSTDAGITKAAAALTKDEATPLARFDGLVAAAVAKGAAPGGADAAAGVAAGGAASDLGLAAWMVEVARAAGLPGRVNQGMLLGEPKPSAHAWAEIKLPKLGFVPVDPALKAAAKDAEGDEFVGRLPADRMTLVIGRKATFPAEGDIPRIEVSGRLSTPFAVKDGKRVGTVTWSATAVPFEPEK